MKYLIFPLLCVLPFGAEASVLLADCDSASYDVMVRNGGSERIVHLTPMSGEIEEFGPVISFQIKSKKDERPHPVVTATEPDEEFCIWSGHIQIQRLNTSGSHNAGVSLR